MSKDNNKRLIVKKILDNLEKVIRGKTQVLKQSLISLLSGGHILLEDVPGVGKTTLAKAIAISLEASYHRVQFTPDLLPADITGINIYQPQSGEFSFRQGPIFSDILLADEINRSSPRTQSALLEAMSERQVTVAGQGLPLGEMFTVIATQNPIDFHGTYPLPEAQLDRFFMCLRLGYPQPADELSMIQEQKHHHPLQTLQSVTTREILLQIREEVRTIEVKNRVANYLLAIIHQTREDPRVRLGISPRGTLALFRATQAHAWMQGEGREFALPDDVKAVAIPLLAHRLMLETKARHTGSTKEEIIREILEKVKVPTL